MKKSKLLLSLLAILLCFGASAQKMRIGSIIVDGGFNYCLYNGSATNMCALTTSSGSMQGFEYTLTGDIVVLDYVTLDADLGANLLTGGTGIDAGVGFQYHFHSKKKPLRWDFFIGGNAGYTHLTYTGGLMTTSGTFNAAGLYYQVGGGVRKYLIHNVGLFVTVNYGGHHYSGGETTENEGLKIPYTIGFSGFTFGGGICVKLKGNHHPLIDP